MTDMKELYDEAYKIYTSTELSWEIKYDLIFSEKISLKVPFDWYDPDMDYEDDVTAFMNAFRDYVGNYKLNNGTSCSMD